MRKIALVAGLLFAMIAFAATKQPVALTATPQSVQDAVAKHFTPEQVLIVTCEKTAPRKYEYELRIAEGTKLVYSNKAQLLKIENEKGIDLNFVPSGIQKYIQETFPNATITKYTCKGSRQDVILNIDIDVVFDKSGRFVRLED